MCSLSPGAHQLGAVGSATYRVLEITLGSFVGLIVSLVLLPARAHRLVIAAAARMLDHLADLLDDWLAVLCGGGDRARITQLQDAIRAEMARLENAAGEAREERRTYLTREFDPDPLVRTVSYLRNDLVMVGRTAAEPLPETIVECLREPLRQVSNATQVFLRACGDALRGRKNPPVFDAVEQAVANFVATIDALRREGVTRELPAEAAGRLFALRFVLEQLQQNLKDFRNRVADCSRAAIGA